MAGNLQIRLFNTDNIPTLEEGADTVEHVVRWRAEMAAWASERGLSPYILGPLPGGATVRDQLEGSQYLLFGIKDKMIRGHGGSECGKSTQRPDSVGLHQSIAPGRSR